MNIWELKRIKSQLRAEILAEQKLPVMMTGTNAPSGSTSVKKQTSNSNQNASQSSQNSRYGNNKSNAIELDAKTMNEKTLGLFSLIYSGKQIRNLPVLKDMKGQIPENLNFENC